MKKTITATKVIQHFLLGMIGTEFPSYAIETRLPDYGLIVHNVIYSPATYGRRFRELREKRWKEMIDMGVMLNERIGESGVKYFTVINK